MLYHLLIGLILAGIVHISIVLMIPNFATRNAWSNLVDTGAAWQFVRLNREKRPADRLLASTDPQFQIAVCRFDLSQSPLLIRTSGILLFWSVAVFDQFGNNVYSLNDRTAIDQQLNLLVVNSVQMADLRQAPSTTVEQSIIFEATTDRGFVLVRALQPDPSWAPEVDRFLGQASCEKLPI